MVGGPNVLNFPGVYDVHRVPVAPVGMAGQAPIQAGFGDGDRGRLLMQLRNRSDPLTITTAQQPVPGACDPNDPIVLTSAAVDFPKPLELKVTETLKQLRQTSARSAH